MPQGIAAILQQQVIAAMLRQCVEALRIAAMRTVYCGNGPIAAILQQQGIAAILWQCSRNCNVAATLQQCPLQGIAAVLRQ